MARRSSPRRVRRYSAATRSGRALKTPDVSVYVDAIVERVGRDDATTRSETIRLLVDIVFSLFQKLVDNNMETFVELVNSATRHHITLYDRTQARGGDYIAPTRLGVAHYRYFDARNIEHDPYTYYLQVPGGHQFCAIHSFNLATNREGVRTRGPSSPTVGMHLVAMFLYDMCVARNQDLCNDLLHAQWPIVFDVNRTERRQDIVRAIGAWVSASTLSDLYQFLTLPEVMQAMEDLS